MSFSDAYLRERSENTDVSGRGNVAATDSATVTLATGKTGWTIFVQFIRVTIITSAAQTLAFQDSAATPVKVQTTDSAPGANAQYEWDFGPNGRQLTEAKDFVMAISAAGLAVHYEFEAYLKQTAIEYINASTTGQKFI